MKKEHFKDIRYFTAEEILATGADLNRVNRYLIARLDKLRASLNASIHLLQGGLTSGYHQSKEHPAGEAADFRLDKAINIDEFLIKAVSCGFFQVGIYWNGKAYSYHVGIGKRYATWSCRISGAKRKYYTLLRDPKYAET